MPWDAVPGKFKRGTLKSGSGHKVTKRSQMIAIMLHEKREAEHGKKEYKSIHGRHMR